MSNYDKENFNFKYLSGGVEGLRCPLKGGHSTRLYAFPGIKLKEYRRCLWLAFLRIVLKKAQHWE